MVHRFLLGAKAASGSRSLQSRSLQFSGKAFSASSLKTTAAVLLSAVLLGLLGARLAGAADTSGSLATAVRPNNLGVAYMNQQRGEDALAQFKLAIAADPSLAVPHMNTGIVLLVLQRLPEAKAELDRAAKIDPTNPRVWYNLGLLERARSNCEASIAAFAQVIKLDPTSADAYYFLGSCYLERQDFAKAADAYREAIRINPMHPSAEFGLARTLQRSGNPTEAKVHLARFEHITHEKLSPVMAPTYGDQGAYSLAQEIKSASPPVGPMIPITFAPVSLANVALPALPEQAKTGPRRTRRRHLPHRPRGPRQTRPHRARQRRQRHQLLPPHRRSKLRARLGKETRPHRHRHATACAVGDFDADTHPDLAITMSDRVILYRNNGDNTFTDVTEKSGIRQTNHPAGLTFIDFDHDGDVDLLVTGTAGSGAASNVLWRNNGNQTFTEWTTPTALGGRGHTTSAILSDLNNDRAVDIAIAGDEGVSLYFNPREGAFIEQPLYPKSDLPPVVGLTILDFNKDGWMDIAVTHAGAPGVTLWKNIDGKRFERVPLPISDATRAWGITPIDFDNDGWIDLAAVVETSKGVGVRVLRNKGDSSFEDVSEKLGVGATLDKPLPPTARSLVALDADGDGDADLLVSTLDGAPILLRNDGGNKNHSFLVTLRGNADNKTAIGTKVEVFAGGLWQKWEVPSASGYLSQGPGTILAGLGDWSEPVIVRLLWPTGVPQDELNIAAKGIAEVKELDRRGSSCPIVFAWNGSKYEFITDTIGAAVIGHWVSPYAHNIPDPDEWVKIEGSQLQAAPTGKMGGYLSLRLGEPMEEVNFVDQARLVAIDHPANSAVYPNERFKNDPPFSETKTIFTEQAHPVTAAWDNNGKDVTATLARIDHQYVRDFTNLPYSGFANTHTLTLDIGPTSPDKPLRLLMHGFIEYFSATSLYAAWQAGLAPISPYVEAQLPDGSWKRIVNDMGFPAGLPRTIVTDLTGKLPAHLPNAATRIRITTNLQIYWDQVLVSNETEHPELVKQTEVPLATASLAFRGYPRQIDGATPGDLTYHYNEASATGPFIRQRGPYTHYGDVTPLLKAIDDHFVIFGSGEDIDLEFNAAALPPLPADGSATISSTPTASSKTWTTTKPCPLPSQPCPSTR